MSLDHSISQFQLLQITDFSDYFFGKWTEFFGYWAWNNNLHVSWWAPLYDYLSDALHVAWNSDTVQLNRSYNRNNIYPPYSTDDVYPLDKDVTVKCWNRLSSCSSFPIMSNVHSKDNRYAEDTNSSFTVRANVMFNEINFRWPLPNLSNWYTVSSSSRFKVLWWRLNLNDSQLEKNYIWIIWDWWSVVMNETEFNNNWSTYLNYYTWGWGWIKSWYLSTTMTNSYFHSNEVGVYWTWWSVIIKHSDFSDHYYGYVPSTTPSSDYSSRIKTKLWYWIWFEDWYVSTNDRSYFTNNERSIYWTWSSISLNKTAFLNSKMNEDKSLDNLSWFVGHGPLNKLVPKLLRLAIPVYVEWWTLSTSEKTSFYNNDVGILWLPLNHDKWRATIMHTTFNWNGIESRIKSFWLNKNIPWNFEILSTPAMTLWEIDDLKIGRIWDRWVYDDAESSFYNTQDEFNIITWAKNIEIDAAYVFDWKNTENNSIFAYTWQTMKVVDSVFIQNEFTDSYYNIHGPTFWHYQYNWNRYVNNPFVHNSIYKDSFSAYMPTRMRRAWNITYVNSNNVNYDKNDCWYIRSQINSISSIEAAKTRYYNDYQAAENVLISEHSKTEPGTQVDWFFVSSLTIWWYAVEHIDTFFETIWRSYEKYMAVVKELDKLEKNNFSLLQEHTYDYLFTKTHYELNKLKRDIYVYSLWAWSKYREWKSDQILCR